MFDLPSVHLPQLDLPRKLPLWQSMLRVRPNGSRPTVIHSPPIYIRSLADPAKISRLDQVLSNVYRHLKTWKSQLIVWLMSKSVHPINTCLGLNVCMSETCPVHNFDQQWVRHVVWRQAAMGPFYNPMSLPFYMEHVEVFFTHSYTICEKKRGLFQFMPYYRGILH